MTSQPKSDAIDLLRELHFVDEIFEDYISGMLDLEARKGAELHLGICEKCKEEVRIIEEALAEFKKEKS